MFSNYNASGQCSGITLDIDSFGLPGKHCLLTYDIQFALDSDSILSSSDEVLINITNWMIKNDSVTIRVSAHHYMESDFSFLTMNRASSICNKLVLLGVPRERMMATGYGSYKSLNCKWIIKKANNMQIHPEKRVEILIMEN